MIVERLSDTVALVADERMIEWTAARLPGACNPDGWRRGMATGLGLARCGKLIAGMVVHDFLPCYKAASISMAATDPRWASRITIRALLRYPFGQLGVNRLTTLISANNHRALRVNAALGFVREGVLRQGFGEDDAIVLGLLRSDAEKWLVEGTSASRSLRDGGGTDHPK